jgi:hypothetical protein
MSALKHLSYFFLPLPLAAAEIVEGKKQKASIVIGHKQCLSSGAYPRAVADQLRQVKWFFAHASVGSNMLDGLADLHASGQEGFPLEFVTTDRDPPASTRNGAIYEHNRGNPGWKAKFDRFEDTVSKGWHFPTVQVAMNKLCYIDQGASFKYYLHSMTNLEARFPDTVMVYATIPLTTATDGDNFLRNAFNDRLREWVQQNGRVLFDIADIEAHDPQGNASTFQHRTKTCQRLCDSYTTDGGHLNEKGRQIVAKGFYELSKSLIDSGRIVAGK